MTIDPQGAITAGATWEVDGGTPQSSGATVSGLSVGNHTVSFSTISGWTTPANQSISVSANLTATGTGVYTIGVPSQFTFTTNSGAIIITGYTGLGGAVTIPDTINGYPVTSIGFEAFYDCTNITSVAIGTNVTSIGNQAFYGCSKLTSVIIPGSVTTIGELAFIWCTSLTSVTIPASVTYIGYGPFSGCSSLTAITVDANNPAYTTVAGVLFDKSQTTLIQCPGGAVGSYAIPTSVTNIGETAFYECYDLTNVTVPNSVTSIGDSAFEYCIGLNNVSIGTGVRTIVEYAFYGCWNLASIYFQGNAPNLGAGTFGTAGSYDPATVYYLCGTAGCRP